MSKFPYYPQLDTMKCGVACLQMICSYYGREFKQDLLSNLCYATNEGVSLLAIKEVANNISMK